MISEINIGELRAQSAYEDGTTPVVLVSDDPIVRAILDRLKIIRFYPDTLDATSQKPGAFKIEIGMKL